MDEIGLFFRALPEKSFCAKGVPAHGGKQSKQRVTVTLFCSANGEKEKCTVIGKAKYPRCFRKNNVKVENLSVFYRHNTKSWMTKQEFDVLVRRFDARMRAQNRTVLLFLDNCSAHGQIDNLTNTQLVFFPPNTTSKLQPVDQGIGACLKLYFRKHLLRKVITHIDDGRSASEIANDITILDAINWIARSWTEVKSETIINCFHKAGFPVTHEDKNDSDVLIVESENVLGPLLEVIGKNMEVTTAHDFASFDASVSTSDDRAVVSGDDLENEIINADGDGKSNDDNYSDDEQGEDPKYTSTTQIARDLESMISFAMTNGHSDLAKKLEEADRMITVSASSNMKQLTLDTFFH